MESFELITYTHVYKENNSQADSASKEGLLLDPGMWKVKEWLGDDAFEYYHCPFFEVVAAWEPVFGMKMGRDFVGLWFLFFGYGFISVFCCDYDS